jgi:hypothetical protein
MTVVQNIAPPADTLAGALAWAARGFRVFPLQSRRKAPRKDSAWIETASSDPAAVRAAWADAGPAANIGVLCGDGLIVVDVDAQKGGLESLLDLELPLDTLATRTPRGGLHLYFRAPADRPNFANGTEKLGPGIDVRAYHGYVLAPGSYVEDREKGYAGPYTLETDAPIQEAPPHLVARLDTPRERAERSTPIADLDTPAAIDLATAYLRDEASPAFEGFGGDACTFKVAAAIKDLGVSEAKAFDLMAENWNERCSPPWDREDLEKKVANAYAYGIEAPGVLSPAAHYQNVSIPPIEERPARAAPASRRFFRHGDSWDDATRWLYFGLLPAAGTALLVGPSGAGKSFLAIGLAVSLATGRPFFGVAPDELGGTIYVATEAQATLAKRLEAAAPSSAPLAVSICGAGALSDAKQLKSLFDDIAAESAAMKDRFGVPCRLIVFDTLSASGLLTDENDNAKAAIALAELQRLSTATGALVLATHHPPKSGTGERGAGALRANVDAILTVQHEAKAKVRDLELTKSRDAEAPRSLGSYELKEVELSKDARGRDLTTCIIKPVHALPKAAQKKAAYAPTLLTSLEHALADESEMIEGHKAAPLEAVREQFKAIKPGSKDRSNIRSAFNVALRWAEETGAVRRVAHLGCEYLIPNFLEDG